MNLKMTSEAERQQKQKELDSILDAALDELGGDSDSDVEGHACYAGEYDDGDGVGDSIITAAAPIGVPYSLDYLASNKQRDTGKLSNATAAAAAASSRRPQFGPEPPPPPSADASSTTLPPLPPFNLSAGEQEELAASLEGMMKQFTEELGGGGNPDMALDDMFKKMMMAEGSPGGSACDPIPPPSAAMPSSSAAANGSVNMQRSSSHQSQNDESSSSSSPKSKNSTPRKGNNGTNVNKEPNVDESINRLLDGINQASNAPLPNNNNNNMLPPGMPDIDPTQFEKMGEEMMNSIMGEFDKMGNANDSNDVVDGVMKQLLDKELMYEPMKEVTNRFPKWLAENKDDLPPGEYTRYGMQYQYFQKIVRIYETEPNNFDRLMELMQDIQEYGQPPVDIIKDLAPELEFDESGMPIMDPTGGGGGGMMMPGMMPGMNMPAGMPPFPGNEQCCIS